MSSSSSGSREREGTPNRTERADPVVSPVTLSCQTAAAAAAATAAAAAASDNFSLLLLVVLSSCTRFGLICLCFCFCC
jgi:hypothetical protein